MKLIYCPLCDDVVKLDFRFRMCKCQQSGGQYHEDGIHADYCGEAVPIGFANSSFMAAVHDQPDRGPKGKEFVAFVIPKECDTMTRIEFNR
jgi:hypothetical protein